MPLTEGNGLSSTDVLCELADKDAAVETVGLLGGVGDDPGAEAAVWFSSFNSAVLVDEVGPNGGQDCGA